MQNAWKRVRGWTQMGASQKQTGSNMAVMGKRSAKRGRDDQFHVPLLESQSSILQSVHCP